MEESSFPELINSDIITYINPKNSLLKDLKKCKILAELSKDLKRIPEYSKRRSDLEFILRACCIIENLVKKKDKLDKFELLVECFSFLFGPLEVSARTFLKDQVDFLWNRKNIKKIRWVRRITRGIYRSVTTFFFK
jgi:hypothetical protein